jgi:hypothetical protein
MADVLANLKTGNLEEVPDSDAALKGWHSRYPCAFAAG